MGNEFVSCSFLLLLFFMHARGNAAGAHMEDATGVIPNGVNVLRLPSMDFVEQKEDVQVPGENHGHSSSPMGMMGMGMGKSLVRKDPAYKAFYFMKDIQVGKTILVAFPYIKESDPSRSLPKEKPDYIPFSLKALPELLRFFSISRDSTQASAMERTLMACEMKRKGEFKECVTSVESLIDFARSVFGSASQVEVLRTSPISKSSPFLQNYTVLQLEEKTAPKIIPCHNMPYPYAVFYCHIQVDAHNRMFKLSLRGENGDRVDAVFVCHMDTSTWDHDYVAFRQLRVKPGTSEACHFFPAYDVAVVPK